MQTILYYTDSFSVVVTYIDVPQKNYMYIMSQKKHVPYGTLPTPFYRSAYIQSAWIALLNIYEL